MAVEAAVALVIRVGCYQELEAHGWFASQRVRCAAHSHQYRSRMPSWAAEAPHVGSALAVELF